MKEEVEQFLKNCMRLPSEAKKYPQYKEMKEKLDNYDMMLPLIEMLSDKSFQKRHWEQLFEKVGRSVPYESESFTLKDFFDFDPLSIQEDIEDISDVSLKQMRIERMLREDIGRSHWGRWKDTELQFQTYQKQDYACRIGGSVANIQQGLHDDILNLKQLLESKIDISPFIDEIQSNLELATHLQDVLQKWLDVQNNWMSLKLVFFSKIIAPQMPTETKIFMRAHELWLTMMERAREKKFVIQCCQSDLLLTSLPKIKEDLN